jgi:peptidoglycan LD-endopeptidase CwlK
MNKRYFALIFSSFLVSLIGCDQMVAQESSAQPMASISQADKRNLLAEEGTLENPLLDSNAVWDQELKLMQTRGFPKNIVEKQQLINLKYYSFDGKIHQGQLVIDKRLVDDIQKIFAVMLEEKFPIHSLIPISRFQWSDDESMLRNNTSAFNYRKVKGKVTLSNHAFGQAIDINPLQNPYVSGKYISPKGAKYDQTQAGTLTNHSRVVQTFLQLGWTWGGHWKSLKDYQHFEKRLN